MTIPPPPGPRSGEPSAPRPASADSHSGGESAGSQQIELSELDLLESSTVLYGERYDLLSMVGAGTFGSVYRARDNELEEIVALKVLKREHLTQPGALARFRKEVRLARRVSHPNVARTYDIGRHEGERFLTMEFIDGQPLTRLCPIGASGPALLPIPTVLQIVRQICAGLGALHAAGIVHQDMKTEKVVLGYLVGRDFAECFPDRFQNELGRPAPWLECHRSVRPACLLQGLRSRQ